MYERGAGVTKNLATAISWFEKSAAQNHKKAEYKLLYISIKDEGLSDLTKTQLGVLRQEAASGNADAQYFLGKMYVNGVGVPKSLDNAITWLNKATFNGVSEAEHEAITAEEELARISEREAKKRELAIENSKKQKAEEEALKIQQKKQAEQLRAAEEAKRKAIRDAEVLRIENERKRLNSERAELAKEKAKLEQEKAASKEDAASGKVTISESKVENEQSTFEADPCQGKKAKFLSTCR
jgi:TPR repeat protein